MGVMRDKAATDFFWQLVSNVSEIDISPVFWTLLKNMPSVEPPASFTDWQVVL